MKNQKSKTKRVVYSRSPLTFTDLGEEKLGEALMAMTDYFIRPMLREGFSRDVIALLLVTAAKQYQKGEEDFVE